jgi:hypothetical protein
MGIRDEISIPAWLWGAIGVVLLGVGGWIGAKVPDALYQLSATQVNHEVRLVALEKGQERIDVKLDRILEEVRTNK